MAFVADASITLAWCLRDEHSVAANQVRDRLLDTGLCVPAHWALEVCSALLAAMRRGRISAEELDALAADLRLLPELVDQQTDTAAWAATLQLAQAHRLTVYDAAYLELARRLELPLATLDRELLAAAHAAGVVILPELQTLR